MAFLVMVMAIGGVAHALPANDVTTTYFADAAKTKWVGSVELTCGGGTISFGRKSQFFKKDSASCRDHRISKSSVLAASRVHRLPPEQVCHNLCQKRFGGPGICLPDGTCPKQDALNECNATCNSEFNGQ